MDTKDLDLSEFIVSNTIQKIKTLEYKLDFGVIEHKVFYSLN